MSTETTAVGALGKLAAMPREGVLRLALKLDAAVTGANGAAYLAGAGALDTALGVPEGLLRGLGAFLLVFAACVWLVATRPRIEGAAVRTVIAINLGWVVASLVFVVAGWHSPTPGGVVWAVLQAGTVAGFAAAQAWTLRRLGPRSR